MLNRPKHNHTALSVCHSNAGYYVGIWCPVCGPYDRISHYMSKEQAEAWLKMENDWLNGTDEEGFTPDEQEDKGWVDGADLINTKQDTLNPSIQ